MERIADCAWWPPDCSPWSRSLCYCVSSCPLVFVCLCVRVCSCFRVQCRALRPPCCLSHNRDGARSRPLHAAHARLALPGSGRCPPSPRPCSRRPARRKRPALAFATCCAAALPEAPCSAPRIAACCGWPGTDFSTPTSPTTAGADHCQLLGRCNGQHLGPDPGPTSGPQRRLPPCPRALWRRIARLRLLAAPRACRGPDPGLGRGTPVSNKIQITHIFGRSQTNSGRHRPTLWRLGRGRPSLAHADQSLPLSKATVDRDRPVLDRFPTFSSRCRRSEAGAMAVDVRELRARSWQKPVTPCRTCL